jgi:hypothetical protein
LLLEYLIADGSGEAFSYPAELFEIVDNTIPSEWVFGEIAIFDSRFRVLGYREYLNYDHFSGLAELNRADVEIFEQAKKRIDEASWLDGECEVLQKLCEVNNLPPIPSRVMIERRERGERNYKVYFYQSSIPWLSTPGVKTDMYVKVQLNKEEYEGYYFLMIRDRVLVGLELFMYEHKVPEEIEKIVVKNEL